MATGAVLPLHRIVLLVSACCYAGAAKLQSLRRHHFSQYDIWEDEIDVVTDKVTHDAINASGQALPIYNASLELTLRSPSNRTVQSTGDAPSPLWVFGVHRKVGASLIRSIVRFQINSLGEATCSADTCSFIEKQKRCDHFSGRDRATVWFACSFNISQLAEARAEAVNSNKPLRVVHVIRDPMAVLVSSYLAKLASRGGELNVSMTNQSIRDGLTAEVAVIKPQLEEMLELAQDKGTDMMVVRFEELIRSSTSFDKAISAIYSFTVGDIADHTLLDSLHTFAQESDLRRHAVPDTAQLQPDKLRTLAIDALSQMPNEVFSVVQEYRTSLGYA